MKPAVQRVFDANFKACGYRKVWRQMQREGFDIARCTVERLMRDLGQQGCDPWQAGQDDGERQGRALSARSGQPTIPCPGAEHAVGLGVGFAPLRITYVATWSGFVYVALASPPFGS